MFIAGSALRQTQLTILDFELSQTLNAAFWLDFVLIVGSLPKTLFI